MCIWFAELEPNIQELFLELSRKPWARSKTTNEECKLFKENQMHPSGGQNARTELVARRWLKLSLIEFTVDWIEGPKNSAICVLNVQKVRCRTPLERAGLTLSVPTSRP